MASISSKRNKCKSMMRVSARVRGNHLVAQFLEMGTSVPKKEACLPFYTCQKGSRKRICLHRLRLSLWEGRTIRSCSLTATIPRSPYTLTP
jgi:hypothetical protein